MAGRALSSEPDAHWELDANGELYPIPNWEKDAIWECVH